MMRRLPPSTPLKTGPPAAAWPAVTWPGGVAQRASGAGGRKELGGAGFDREAVGVAGVDTAEQGVNEAFEHLVTDPWAHHFAYGGVWARGSCSISTRAARSATPASLIRPVAATVSGSNGTPRTEGGDRTERTIGPDERLSAGGGDEVIAQAEFVTEFDDLRLASEKAVGGHVDGEREFGAVDEARVDLAARSRRGFEDDDVEPLAASLVGGGRPVMPPPTTTTRSFTSERCLLVDDLHDLGEDVGVHCRHDAVAELKTWPGDRR